MCAYWKKTLSSLISLMVSLLFVANGCGSPFPPRSLVERLRVLGIRAADANNAADASINLTTMTIDSSMTLTALIVGPFDPTTVDTTWGICLTPLSDEASSIDCPGANSFPLPSFQCTPQTLCTSQTDPCTSFISSVECTSQIEPSELEAWIAQQGLDPATIDPTLTQVDLWIGFLVTYGDDEIRAVKRLPVHLYREGSPPLFINHNPVLTGIKQIDRTTADADIIEYKLSDKINLKPEVGDNPFEPPDDSPFETFIPSGETSTRQEDLVYSWFSTVGEFELVRTVLSSTDQDSKLDENEWKIPSKLTDEQKADSFLWLVVRDGRFGVDWKVLTTQMKTSNNTP